MALCRVASVSVPNAEGAAPEEDLAFEITLDVAEPLKEDVVFRCVYVVDAARPELDAELDSLDVGNGPGLPQGLMRFVLEAPAPSRSLLETGGPLEVGGVYLSGSYRGAEFCRVGYYVRHEYTDPAMQEDPPSTVDWTKLVRVLSDPCVTRFTIAWDAPAPRLIPGADGVVEGESAAIDCSGMPAGASIPVPDTVDIIVDDASTKLSRERSRSPIRVV